MEGLKSFFPSLFFFLFFFFSYSIFSFENIGSNEVIKSLRKRKMGMHLDDSQKLYILLLIIEKEMSVRSISKMFGISQPCIYSVYRDFKDSDEFYEGMFSPQNKKRRLNKCHKKMIKDFVENSKTPFT
jgi:hypothetical protein